LDASAEAAKVRDLQAKMRSFTKQTGLSRQSSREGGRVAKVMSIEASPQSIVPAVAGVGPTVSEGFELTGFSYEGNFKKEFGDKYLYHTSPFSNIEAIKDKGLLSNSGSLYKGYTTKEVALATNTAEARYFESLARVQEGVQFDREQPFMLLRVKVSNTNAVPYKWHVNEVRSGAVSPELLEIWDGKKWLPLVVQTVR
jgi:hypothetical protein